MRVRLSILLFALMLAAPAVARAEEAAAIAPLNPEPPKKTVIDLTDYQLERGQETPLELGRRFLDDVAAANPALKAAISDAARYEIHKDETEKWARQKRWVLMAYGVAWAVLAIFAIGLLFRQKKLSAELDALEAQIKRQK